MHTLVNSREKEVVMLITFNNMRRLIAIEDRDGSGSRTIALLIVPRKVRNSSSGTEVESIVIGSVSTRELAFALRVTVTRDAYPISHSE